MGWQYTPYTYPLLGAAAISMALAWYTWRRRAVPGAISFSVAMVAVMIWALGYALELSSVSLAAKLWWAKIQYVGIVSTPAGALVFAIQYTHHARWLTRRNLAIMALLPAAALLVVWTNDLHHWLWSTIQLDASGSFATLKLGHGPAFWAIVLYAYLALLLAVGLVFQMLFRLPRVYRGQVAAMLVATLVPWTGNVLYVTGSSPFPSLDPTPLAFTLSSLAIVLGLFRFRLLDIMPVAHEAIVNSMDDAVIVIDVQGRIVALNPSAARLVGLTAARAVGQQASEALAALPALASRCGVEAEGHSEITLGETPDRYVYDCQNLPLRDSRRREIGRLVVLRDITERKRAAQVLQASELRYRTLFEASTDAILIATLDGHVLDCNAAACEMLGYTDQEMRQLNVADLVPEEMAPMLPRMISTEFMTGGVFSEATTRRKNGQIFPVEVSTRLITIEQMQLVIAYVRDISERQSLQRQSTERRLYLESVLACAPDAIVTLDAQGQIMEWNRGAEELFGYSRDEAVGRDLDTLVSRSDAQMLEEAAGYTRWVLAGQTLRPTETVRYRRDGTPIHLILTGAPILVQGKAAGVVAIYTDLTERKQSEQTIRQSRAELARRNRELALLNRVISASATSQEIEPILQIVCRELTEAFHALHSAAALIDQKTAQLAIVAEYQVGGRVSVLGQEVPLSVLPLARDLIERQQPLLIADARSDPRLGRVRDLIPSDSPLTLAILPILIEGEMVGGLGMAAVGRSFTPEEIELAQAVAEQVSGSLARARLAAAERRLSTAVDQAAEAVMVTDAQARIEYINPALERIVGTSRAEVVGRFVNVLNSDRLTLLFRQEMWQAETGYQAWHERFDYTQQDGRVSHLDLTVAPVRDQAGEIVSYVATMRDATREAQLETEFREAQKMEALGRLAGGVSHDFNNLLTIIKGSAQMLELKLKPGDPRLYHVRPILDTVERAARLTGQLVSFSRRGMIRPGVVSLNQVVSELSSLLRRVIGEDIQLVTVLADDLWSIQADPTQIDQVIANLTVNARDAMPRGGVLTIETRNQVLDQSYVDQHPGAQPGEFVMLTVSDTGVGMAEDIKARIFEPFFTTKVKGEGTGLGLATVFGIVSQSQGRIEVYSQAGMGTTFMIYFPRTLKGQAAPEPSMHNLPWVSNDLMRGTETVLVVEDDAAVRELVVRVLSLSGYRMLVSADALEALQLAAQHPGPIHLLLSDVVLPYMRGDELAGELLKTRPDTRVLYISGYTDGAIAQPGVLFLPKPFSIADLTRIVREALVQSDEALVQSDEAPIHGDGAPATPP